LEKCAVCLISGGLDSAVTLAIAQSQKFDCYALSFRYGQRHLCEIESAKKIAESAGVIKHLIMDVDLSSIGGSALTTEIPVPKGRTESMMRESVPITYVPARNTVFLSLALAWAETLRLFDIFIGVNALDYSGYPDCRPEYIQAFEKMANLATKRGIGGDRFIIHTPLIEMTKAGIIQRGVDLGVDFSLTHSCYDPSPDGLACGLCDSCLIRKKGFHEAGIPDPIKYVDL
jgi:7-cyano-7-deazaguanine synthase